MVATRRPLRATVTTVAVVVALLGSSLGAVAAQPVPIEFPGVDLVVPLGDTGTVSLNDRETGFQEGAVDLGGGADSSPWGAAVAPDGSVYVSDAGIGAVVGLDPDGESVGPALIDQAGVEAMDRAVSRASDPPARFVPRGLVVDRDGALLVVDAGLARVLRREAGTGVAVEIPGAADHLTDPVDIELDGRGDLLVSDRGEDDIERFDARTGEHLGTLALEPGDEPGGMALAPDGRLVVALTGRGEVVPIDLDSGEVGDPLAVGLERPLGIAIDADGTLWVSDSWAGTVTAHDPFTGPTGDSLDLESGAGPRLIAAVVPATAGPDGSADAASRPGLRTQRWLERLPESAGGVVDFVESDGTADEDVDYAAIADDYAAVLTDGHVAVVPDGADAVDAVVMEVVGGAEEPEKELLDRSPLGSATDSVRRVLDGVDVDREAWEREGSERDGKRYERSERDDSEREGEERGDGKQAVQFRDVLPGVDLVYSADGADLEYSFVIDPGADPDDISLDFDGATSLSITDDGDLLIGSDDGPALISTAPVTYQQLWTGRVEVASAYVIRADGTVGFQLGDYRADRPVIIDPTFVAVETASGSYASGGTIDLPVPSIVATDDLMIAQVAYNATGASIIAPPAGWTQITQSGANGITQALYWRIATASEPASYSFTLSSGATDTAAGAITLYDGVDTTNPIDATATQTNASGAAVTAPSVTTTVAGATLAAFFAVRDSNNGSGPAGMTERTDVATDNGGAPADNTLALAADQTLGAAGSTGTRTATVDASAGSVGTLVALTPAAGGGGGTNLVMVTPDGAFGAGDDTAKKAFFESLGWTVTAIDDSASSAAFITAAGANDVMYVSDTINDTAHETKVRDADIGVVNEKYGPMGIYLFGSPNDGWVNDTGIRIVDNSHYITSPFATGTLAIYGGSHDLNYWMSGTTALPAGVQVLADQTSDANHETLYVADTGASLYSGNTAPNRRVFVPSDAAGHVNWNADYKTIIERSLDWAAGAASVAVFPTVTVNSTGDTSDASPGDDVCDTGGTNADGDPECTLRAALEEANASATVDAIRFLIPTTDAGHSSGVWTITPATTLPVIIDTVRIDGTTQAGTTVNTADFPAPIASSLAIRLSGILLTGTDEDGLSIVGSGADGTEIRGLSITDFDDGSDEAILIWDSSNNIIAGNHLGADAAGSTAAGNSGGMYLGGASADNVVGGTSPADRNVIAGNGNFGILVESATVDLTVQGNDFGILTDGSAASNGWFHIFTDGGATATVGGVAAGAGNRISNGGVGVAPGVAGGGTVNVMGNHIWGNSSLGIDNLGDGVTANDAGDVDTGTNGLLNFPVITSAVGSGSTVSVDYALDVPAGTYRVEFFSNPSGAGATGYGEGELFVHAESITHTGSGSEPFSTSFTGSMGDVIAATATLDLGGGTHGGTSEFSLAATVANGACVIDSDSDGLWDCQEDADTDADGDPSTNPGPDTDGDTTPNHLDADDDGDGVPTASEDADPNADGDPRDALDSDKDGQPDWLDRPTDPTGGRVVEQQKISDSTGGLLAALTNDGWFGFSVTAIGDLDGDGIGDLAASQPRNDDGGNDRGAVHVLFMNADGTVRAEQRISDTTGGLVTTLGDGDYFGTSVADLGDLDGDGIGDLAVGALLDDDGGGDRGAVYILFLNADGTVKTEQKISATAGGLGAVLDDGDYFGSAVDGLGDLDGDGIVDLAVGVTRDDDGVADGGAVFVLFLNADGTVKAQQKISGTQGGLTGLDGGDWFGASTSTLGDVDGDGVVDLAVGSVYDDDGGTDRGATYVLFLNTDGTVRAQQKISDTAGGLAASLVNSDYFGYGSAPVGDLDGDGTPDLAVGAPGDDAGGTARGAILVLYLNTDGTVRAEQEISSTSGNLTGLDAGDFFGASLASVGDLDGDGTIGLAVSAYFDDDGGTDRGAVYVLDLAPYHCTVDSDGDGLWDCEEDADLDADGDPSTNPGPDTDGDTTPDHLDADDDGDGTPTASEGADPNGDGDPRDAADTDQDGQPDYLDAPSVRTGTTVANEQKISSTAGGLTGPLDGFDMFGQGVAPIGDLDGDGIVDLAVGAYQDDDGINAAGAVHILFLNADGTVKAEQKISSTSGGLTGPLGDADQFGRDVAAIGDLDGDGRVELAVGAFRDDDGGTNRGAVYILFLNADGTVRAEQKLSDTAGGFATTLGDSDEFGRDVAGLGDVDGDGIGDLAVGAIGDDDGGTGRGAVYVLFLNADGTVKGEQKISSTTGGLTGPLDDSDQFGLGLAGLGDLDGDGVRDLAAGAYQDDDGAAGAGAMYVLFLNATGTVKAEQKISATSGGLQATLDGADTFGSEATALGDLDRDGVVDLAVGAPGDDDGAGAAGAVHLLFLRSDGTVKREAKISSTSGGLTGPLEGFDGFGHGIAPLGDLDGDGTLDLAVGAFGDDDGASSAGAVYVLRLVSDTTIIVNSTGDGADLAPGDDACDTGGTNSIGDPECTLRAAIQEANASATTDTIAFAIPTSDPGHAAGIWTMTPASGYGALNGQIMLDATTQPGWTADPVIELDGTSAAGSTAGLLIHGDDNEVRGFIVHSFPDEGIEISGFAGNGDRNIVAGNWVGVDRTGAARGNADDGILVTTDAVDNVIGGTGVNDGNVVVDSGGNGINVRSLGTDRTVVVGNTVGLAPDGSTQMGNAGAGISVSDQADGTTIGGTTAAAANVIVANGGDAITISAVSATGTAVLGNRMWASGGLGIDLVGGIEDGNGVTANDAGDVDTGPNGLLNHPVITLVTPSGGTATVDYQLDVPAGNYRIEFHADDTESRNPAGYGAGEVLLGSQVITHTGSGVETFQATITDLGDYWLAATATEDLGGGSYGSTSEFGRTVCVGDSDGDGLCDRWEALYGDTDGDTVPNELDSDDDGDGVPTASENADPNGDGDPRDALDTDRDRQSDWLDVEAGPSTTPIAREQKISSTQGGLTGPLADGDQFGSAVSPIGDIDGDGVNDIVVGAYTDSDGGIQRGAVYVLRLNADGTVKAEQKISSSAGGLTGPLDNADLFGFDATGLGDLDGDGIGDIAVGAYGDDDGGGSAGAVYILFLNADGSVKGEQKISGSQGGWVGGQSPEDRLGNGLAGLGDLDGDGVPDLAVGEPRDDDGGIDRGAVHILFLNANGTVKAQQKISDTVGGLAATLADDDWFGLSVTNLGDVDGDGIVDLAAGIPQADDGGTDRGAVMLLFLNADGTVKAEQRISQSAGGGVGLDDGDNFGDAVSALGDLDGDGIVDLAVGASKDDDGGADAGALWMFHLDSGGNATSSAKISATSGGLTGPLEAGDWFAYRVAGLGDLDGDGTLNLAIGARGDDDGGADRGAVYVLDLWAVPTDTIVVNSTGDGTDANPGDDYCDTGGTNSQGDPECTLRAAIQEANASALVDTIHFDTPDALVGGAHTIAVGSGLPVITAPVAIDGTTEPDFGGTPVVVLDGSATGASGLELEAGSAGSTVAGLAIHSFGGDGIVIATGNNVIAGNRIGTDHLGTGGLGNGGAGIYQWNGANNRIGGIGADGNLITGNTDGIVLDTGADDGNAIIGNGIWANALLGIDLRNDGVTANDAGDVDAGPNGRLNYPVITGVNESGGTLTVDVDLDVPAGTYRIEFFTNPSGPDTGGYGEGETFVHAESIVHTGSGIESFSASFAGASTDVLTATTTQDLGGGTWGATSEFSAASIPDLPITVNSTGDAADATPGDGLCDTGGTNSEGADECTLRAAIGEANGSAANYLVSFAIPVSDPNHSGGIWTITPATAYATITGGMSIDAQTQPGWAASPGTPVVQLDAGTIGGTTADGFRINSGTEGVTIRGLAITRAMNNLIDIRAGVGHVIAGNHLGTDAAGTIATNAGTGAVVWVQKGTDITIGGTGANDGNLITDGPNGIVVDGTNGVDGVTIAGNRIGTNVTGNVALGPIDFDGIRIEKGPTNVVIGGPDPGAGNVIGGVGQDGVNIDGETTDGATVEGNSIGVGTDGTSALAVGGDGIFISTGADSPTIVDNVVGNAALVGIEIDGDTVGGTIQGNLVGLDAGGNAHPMQQDGILLDSGLGNPTGILVGGTLPAEANTVANAGAGGTWTRGIAQYSSGTNTFLGNSLHDNAGLGIDLGADDVTPNDAGDVDGGPNGLLNFPVVTAVTESGGTLSVDYDLDVPAGTYRVEFFTNTVADHSGNGEAETFRQAQTIVHTGSGAEPFSTSFSGSVDDLISATATVSLGGGVYAATSELSAVASIAATVNSTGDAGDDNPGDGFCTTGGTNADGDPECTLRAAIEEANVSSIVEEIHFAIPTTDPNHLAGVWTTTPATGLPAITAPVVLDGATQPGWVDHPVIAVDGTDLASGSGLTVSADDTTVRSLAIGNAPLDGLVVTGARATIIANHLGTDATGSAAVPNGDQGLQVNGVDATIADNLVSGNTHDGILLGGAHRAVLTGNLIGTDSTGNAALANGEEGVQIEGADDVVIGQVGDGNVIAGNGFAGIIGWMGSPTGVVIQANSIGLGLDGVTVLPNAPLNGIGGVAVLTSASGWLVGGTGAGEGNTIVGNIGDGVQIGDTNGTADNIAVLGNTIVGNTDLGIDLAGDGPSANDVGDVDTGPNGRLNHPVITGVAEAGGTLTVDVDVDAPAGDYRVEFFANPSGVDPTGFGEGEAFAHGETITHTGSGVESFQVVFAGAANARVTSTLTEDLGGGSFGATSEFSAAATGPLVVNSTGDGADAVPGNGLCDTGGTNADGDPECTLRAAIEEANAAVEATIGFAIPATDPGHTAGSPEWWTIEPASGPLPALTSPVVLDGTTQPGWVDRPVIVVDGATRAGLSATDDGFDSVPSGSTVRGLAIVAWPDDGASTNATGVTFAGNWFGVWPDGTVAANASSDLVVFGAASATVVGGPGAGDGNIFAAAGADDGVIVEGTASATVVESNGFGVDIGGTTSLASVAAEAMTVRATASDTTITGNWFGDLPQAALVAFADATGTVITGNWFGTDTGGTADHPIGSAIWTQTTGTVRIGGTGPGDGNVITNSLNGGAIGVDPANAGTVTILGNRIVGNDFRGIDLGTDGVTANDAGDVDTGANGLLNFPEIISALESGGTVTATFDLDVPVNADGYRVEFFANPSGADPNGYGEGETLLGSVDVAGTVTGATFAYAGSIGDILTATTTEILGAGFGATSEFSQAMVASDGVLRVNSTGDGADAFAGNGVCDTGGTNAEGDPECTLRAAIEEANASKLDVIEFAIPVSDPNHSAGVWTISPAAGPYDDLVDTVTIDGTTQPGWVDDPVIGLDGTGYSATPDETDDGLELLGDDSVVRGLSIHGFADELIKVTANRVTIRSSWFGVDPLGTVVTNPSPTTSPHAVQVSGDDFVFGGPTDADGNVVAANSDDVVLTGTSARGLIENNHFGVAGDGVTALGSAADYGLRLRSTSADTIVRNNQFANLAVGGIRVDQSARATVVGNLFGTDPTLTASLPIQEAIAVHEAAVVRFGGTGPGEANTVRNATGPAVGHVAGATGTLTVLGNSIVGSAGLGIDLGVDGITANDAGDVDTGPNGLLNFPEITSAIWSGGTVTVDYTLDAPAGDYRIEFFLNPSGANPSGNGEGETLHRAESITHTGSGVETFSASWAGAVGQVVTATATEDLGGGSFGATSEFSVAATSISPNLVVNSTGDTDDATPGDGVCDTGATNAEGDPECTLRAALTEINAAGSDGLIVEFAIPVSDLGYSAGPDAFTITPTGPYPILTRQVTIDGSTQAQYATLPVIVLDGSSAGLGASGLRLGAGSDGSVINALTIHSYDQMAIRIDASDSHVITGNVLGLDVDGDTARGNRYGLYADTSVGLIIGGTTTAERNVISANDWGVALYNDSTDAVITGNLVGTDATGLLDRGNVYDGLFIVNSSSRARVGGPTAAEANVLAGNGNAGVYIGSGTMADAVVQGNLVNVGADGLTTLPNDIGVELAWGQSTQVLDNTIGPARSGITLTNHDGAVITGNAIGTDPTGTQAWSFAEAAVVIDTGSDDATIGGTAPADGNLIRNGGAGGVVVTAAAGTGHAIIGNSIVANTGLGVDLAGGTEDAFGATANDAGDGDAGPNDLLNRPALSSSVESVPGTLTTTIQLDVPAGTYRLELYRAQTSGAVDDSGAGEGELLLGTDTLVHAGSGPQTFTATHPGAAGNLISATVTEDLGGGDWGSTSEFSRARVAVAPGQVVVNDTADDSGDTVPGDGVCDAGGVNSEGEVACTLRAAIEEVNAAAGSVDTIRFDIPSSDGGHTAGVWTIETLSALPAITQPVDLDATTQPGWSVGPGTPVVELDGTAAGVGTSGFFLASPSVTIRSLAIIRFDGDGIAVGAASTGGVVIAGNHIGLDPTGLVARGNGGRGIDLQAGSGPSTVGGTTAADRNVISANASNGIIIGSDANTVVNNLVGTDRTGNASGAGIGNGGDGLFLVGTAAGNVIGQTGLGNVLSGNGDDGFESNATGAGNVVRANTIGLGLDGDTIVANGRHGIVLYDGTNATTIGGAAAGEGNVVSGNTEEGIRVDGNANPATTGNTIVGNRIGTDATGLLDRGNGTIGVNLFDGAVATVIGGATAAEGNVISGNVTGIRVADVATSGTVIRNNLIGTDVGGVVALANDADGIRIESASATEVADNTISSNGASGVHLDGATGTAVQGNHLTANVTGIEVVAGTGNHVLANLVHDNSGLGIDLVGGTEDGAGVTANDAGDGDSGPNDLLNFPVIGTVQRVGGDLVIDVTLDAPAGDHRIEVFANTAADPSGHGEGETPLGGATVTHTGGGPETFRVTVTSAATILTATTTEDLGGGSYGSTSEFSAAVPSPDLVIINSTGDGDDATPGDGQCDTGGTNATGDPECTLRAAITEANDATTPVDTIWFAIPATDPGHAAGVWTIAPASALPAVTDATTIDATTQPGWSATTTAAPAALDGAPAVAIDGTSAGSTAGLVVDGDGVSLSGLAVGGFAGHGLELNGTGATVTAILVGTDTAGLVAAPNTGDGIHVSATATGATIGGATPADRVLVSGNGGSGLDLAADGVTVTGAIIGLDATGTTPLANGADGVAVSGGTGGRIGGTNPAEANLIGGNGGDGVSVAGASTVVAVLGNRIVGNGGLAIDLAGGTEDGAGVTANDAGDGDTGANDLLNAPVLGSAAVSGSSVDLAYSIDLPAGTWRIEFFANPTGPDPSGHGELGVPIGTESVAHPGTGSLARQITLPGTTGTTLTATATRDLGGGSWGATSEASNAATAVPLSALTVEDDSVRRSDLVAAGGLDPTAAATTGTIGRALTLDGADDRLVGPGLDLVDGALTLGALVRADTLTGVDRVISKRNSASNPIYELAVDGGTGEAVATLGLGGGVTARGGTIATGAWHQLLATWDGADLVLHVDGVEVDRVAAAGTLPTDTGTDTVIGNVVGGTAGFDGLIEHVIIEHRAHDADRVAIDRTAVVNGAGLLTVGAEENGVPGPWTVSGAQTRSGGSALLAPETVAGSGAAWAVATGLDEIGVAFRSWWWLSTDTGVDLAAGTRAGVAPTDEFEAALTSPSGWELRRRSGATEATDAAAAGVPGVGTWIEVELQTDQDGNSRILIDGVPVTGWTAQGADLASGSVGLRSGLLPTGERWYVDDARGRKLVTPEPVTSLGALDRQ